jgi:RNA polymerase primary sigma factor
LEETLSPRELRVLQLHFGLDESGTYSLEQIGQFFGLTRERVRQIETGAFAKLRQAQLHRRLHVDPF